ncbi:MAG TPA: hypothetical protein PLE90_07580, partial [Dysgonamonadaceae bacterium]|nr:hypothetical protein [Dysgonamonadaceae bacterium]
CYRKTGKTRVYTQFRSRNEAQPQHCHACTIFFVSLSYRQRLVLPYADNTLQALRAIPAK